MEEREAARASDYFSPFSSTSSSSSSSSSSSFFAFVPLVFPFLLPLTLPPSIVSPAQAEYADTPAHSFDIITTEREWTLCAESQVRGRLSDWIGG